MRWYRLHNGWKLQYDIDDDVDDDDDDDDDDDEDDDADDDEGWPSGIGYKMMLTLLMMMRVMIKELPASIDYKTILWSVLFYNFPKTSGITLDIGGHCVRHK